MGNCLCYKFMHNITITYQHTQRLSYAADRMGQSLVQIFQSPVYMRLNWSDTNGTWAGMSLYHTPTIYRSKAVPIFVRSSDMIPVLGDEKKRKKNCLVIEKLPAHILRKQVDITVWKHIKYNLCDNYNENSSV